MQVLDFLCVDEIPGVRARVCVGASHINADTIGCARMSEAHTDHILQRTHTHTHTYAHTHTRTYRQTLKVAPCPKSAMKEERKEENWKRENSTWQNLVLRF
jgi:hypothetical protein